MKPAGTVSNHREWLVIARLQLATDVAAVAEQKKEFLPDGKNNPHARIGAWGSSKHERKQYDYY